MWIGEWLHCLCSLEIAFQIGSVSLAVYLISKFSAVFLHFVGFKRIWGQFGLLNCSPPRLLEAASRPWKVLGLATKGTGDQSVHRGRLAQRNKRLGKR